MRGRTWTFMAAQTASTILASSPKMDPKEVARLAADMQDALYMERMLRNAADHAAAEKAAEIGDFETESGLHSAADCMGEGDDS
jgi:hypothetical protein